MCSVDKKKSLLIKKKKKIRCSGYNTEQLSVERVETYIKIQWVYIF